MSGQLQAPAALPLGKSLRYPLDRKLGGPRWQIQKNSIIAPAGTEPGPPTRNLLPMVTSYHGCYHPHIISMSLG